MVTTVGVAAFYNRPLAVIPADGETYILNWGTNTITFTFKNIPVVATDVLIGATTTDTVIALVNTAKNQFQLFNDFYIVQITTNFRIQARNTGTTYSVTDGGTALGHFLSGFVTPGVDEVKRQNFRLYVDFFVENSFGSGSFDLVLASSLTPGNDQQVVYDPNDLAWGTLDYSVPFYNSAAPQLAVNVLKRFLIKISEYYDDIPHIYESVWSDLCILAALKEADIPVIDFNAEYFTTSINRKFLTTIPRNSINVTKTQQYYLNYYQKPAFNEAYLYVKLLYNDGTYTHHDKIFTLSQPGQVMCLPVGYAGLDIDTLKTMGKTVSHYQVMVWQDGTTYLDASEKTETINISINTNYYENNKYFLFNNSLSGFDSIRCTGHIEHAITAENRTFRKYKNADTATIINGEEEQNTTNLRESIKVNTGVWEIEQVNHLRELLAAEIVFEDINGQFVAIVINRESIEELYTSEDFVYGLQFQYTYAQFNNA